MLRMPWLSSTLADPLLLPPLQIKEADKKTAEVPTPDATAAPEDEDDEYDDAEDIKAAEESAQDAAEEEDEEKGEL